MAKIFIFKFGGASVKDSASVKNLAQILINRLHKPLIIVISAMGKTTNALEKLLELKMSGQTYSLNSTKLKDFHLNICTELFEPQNRIFSIVENEFTLLSRELEKPLNKDNYDEFYDQVVSFGELISTRIVHEYLCSKGMFFLWQDAREIIRTNSDFRFAKVDWRVTEKLCAKHLLGKLEKYPLITQGFIGSDSSGRTTTLGREGSDFTAAIFAHCVKATSVTIWKDVIGVLNADPKRFAHTVKFEELDYREAAEMTYYGATVIHPKTIKPLANLSIPLYVKSFLNPEDSGTKIHQVKVKSQVPCIVIKEDQILVSFGVTDFTFINEAHIHQVFEKLEQLHIRVNLLQTSAITISIVIDKQLFQLEKLIQSLKPDFFIRFNEGQQLITVIHPNEEIVHELRQGKIILLEQITRSTFQMVYSESAQ